MMRVIKTTIIAAFVLATASAAVNIKWKKSKELDFVPVTTTLALDVTVFEKTLDSYAISWASAFSVGDIDCITAIFYGWDAQYLAIKKECGTKGYKPEKTTSKIEVGREQFQNTTFVFVNIRAYNQTYANLLDNKTWEVELSDAEGVYKPSAIRKVNDPLENVTYTIKSGNDTLNAKARTGTVSNLLGTNLYLLTFDRPYGENPPRDLKLILKSGAGTYGFEWRFKQD